MDTQRVAVVTNGTGTLGEAICRTLADRGYRVVATYGGDAAEVASWSTGQRSGGYSFSAFRIDPLDGQASSQVVMEILRDTGRIDLLINNVDPMWCAPWAEMTHGEWRRTVDEQLDSVFVLTKAVLHGMLEENWGRIVNIAPPDEGVMEGADLMHVGRSALHGFTKSLAQEVAAKGITVNTVSPGALRNVERAPLPALAPIPIGRRGEPREVAALVAYLCSDIAGFVTGANIAINGGQHLH